MRRFLLVMVLSLTALASSSKAAQALDKGDLESWLERAGRDLEKWLGPLPPVKVELARGRVAELEWGDIHTHLALQFPNLEQKAPGAAADALAVSRLVALARGHKETIWVEPANHTRMPAWNDALDGANSNDLVKLAVVHERIRLALEARFSLDNLRAACREPEEWFALQAVIEGRCQQLTLEFARLHQLEKAFPFLALRYLYVPDGSPDPILRTVSQAVVRQKFWAYEHGLGFWQYLHEQGQAKDANLFAHPPKQAKAIERPDLFLRARANPRPDLAQVLASIEGLMPATEWAAFQQTWTPAMFVQVAGLLKEKDRAEKLTTGWDDGRSLIWSRQHNPATQIALSVVRYDSIAGARGYFGFALDLQRKRDEMSNLPCGLPLKVVESRPASLALRGADEACCFEKKMQVIQTKETIAAWILLARQGERVVEITWHGQPADAAWAQRVLDLLAGTNEQANSRPAPPR